MSSTRLIEFDPKYVIPCLALLMEFERIPAPMRAIYIRYNYKQQTIMNQTFTFLFTSVSLTYPIYCLHSIIDIFVLVNSIIDFSFIISQTINYIYLAYELVCQHRILLEGVHNQLLNITTQINQLLLVQDSKFKLYFFYQWQLFIFQSEIYFCLSLKKFHQVFRIFSLKTFLLCQMSQIIQDLFLKFKYDVPSFSIGFFVFFKYRPLALKLLVHLTFIIMLFFLVDIIQQYGYSQTHKNSFHVFKSAYLHYHKNLILFISICQQFAPVNFFSTVILPKVKLFFVRFIYLSNSYFIIKNLKSRLSHFFSHLQYSLCLLPLFIFFICIFNEFIPKISTCQHNWCQIKGRCICIRSLILLGLQFLYY